MNTLSFGNASLWKPGSTLQRVANEAAAAERREALTGATPWVELPPGVSLPGIRRGKRRYALAKDVWAWLESTKRAP